MYLIAHFVRDYFSELLASHADVPHDACETRSSSTQQRSMIAAVDMILYPRYHYSSCDGLLMVAKGSIGGRVRCYVPPATDRQTCCLLDSLLFMVTKSSHIGKEILYHITRVVVQYCNYPNKKKMDLSWGYRPNPSEMFPDAFSFYDSENRILYCSICSGTRGEIALMP